MCVSKGSIDAEVIDELKPMDNEIIIPKTSSSVFNSTNIEYVLKNLSIQYLMIMGIVTDQCVETAVRDGCDKGFLITLIESADLQLLKYLYLKSEVYSSYFVEFFQLLSLFFLSLLINLQEWN